MSVMHGPCSNHLSKTLKSLIFHPFLGSLSVSPPSLHWGFGDSVTIKAVWAELWMTLRKEWSVLIPGGSSLSLLAEADASSPVAISYGTCAPLKVPDGHSLCMLLFLLTSLVFLLPLASFLFCPSVCLPLSCFHSDTAFYSPLPTSPNKSLALTLLQAACLCSGIPW